MEAKRILIIDDDETFARVLSETLEEESDFKVVGVLKTEEESLNYFDSCAFKSIDCILLDLRLPTSSWTNKTSSSVGLRLLQQVRSKGYFGSVIILTSSISPEDGKRALEAGCDGYLCKSTKNSDLPMMLDNLKTAIRGKVMVISRQMRFAFFRNDVSMREAQLMDFVADGKPWADIARNLGYSSPKAAANIADRIYDKLLSDEDRCNIESLGLKKKIKAVEIWKLRTTGIAAAG